MNCRVLIFGGADRDGKYISEGELTFCGGGFELKYFLDGDNCLLNYDGETLRQVRRGSVALKLIFKSGQETVCTLGEGNLSGEFTIFTNKLSVEITDGGIDLRITYDCGGESNRLFLTAEKIQEKR